MTVNGTETLFLTFAFLVPGFIWHSVQSLFVVKRSEPIQVLFLRLLTFSCLNYALWAGLIYAILILDTFRNSAFRTGVAWGCIIFISPTVLGVLGALNSQKGWLRWLFRKVGLASIHEIPTAWDYKFSKTDRFVWVQVTLTDGTRIAGKYGSKSFSSSAAEERDLYLQELMKITKEGWKPIPRSDGILVKGNEIKYIEFIRN